MAVLAAALVAACRPDTETTLRIRDAWASPTPPNATVGAAYLEILVTGGDTLLSVTTPIANRVEMHLSHEEHGVMKMRPLPSVALEAREPFRFEPGHAHLMLIGLKQPLAVGTRFPLTLHLREAGKTSIEVEVTASQPHNH